MANQLRSKRWQREQYVMTWMPAGQPCPHYYAGGCQLAGMIARVPGPLCQVTDADCRECMDGPEPTPDAPTPPVVRAAERAGAGHTAPKPKPRPETPLPCVHRGPKIREHKCRPCQNAGVPALPVYACDLHAECIQRGAAPGGPRICLTCPDRTETTMSDVQTFDNPTDFQDYLSERPRWMAWEYEDGHYVARRRPKYQERGIIYLELPNGKGVGHAWANRYREGHCVLVCGGPSINDMDLSPIIERRRGLVVAAVNNIAATHVRPDLWFSVDQASHFHHSIYADPSITKFIRRDRLDGRARMKVGDEFRDLKPLRQYPNLIAYKYQGGWEAKTWLDQPLPVWGGQKRSVMLAALRILVDLGFRSIYLIGCDFSMQMGAWYAFDEQKIERACNSNNALYAWLNTELGAAWKVAREMGVEIINCTPGGNLRSLPRLRLADALQRVQGQHPPAASVRGYYTTKEG